MVVVSGWFIVDGGWLIVDSGWLIVDYCDYWFCRGRPMCLPFRPIKQDS